MHGEQTAPHTVITAEAECGLGDGLAQTTLDARGSRCDLDVDLGCPASRSSFMRRVGSHLLIQRETAMQRPCAKIPTGKAGRGQGGPTALAVNITAWR